MKRTLIQPDFSQFPEAYLPLLGKYPVYDSMGAHVISPWGPRDLPVGPT